MPDCKNCGKPIAFENKDGKWLPINEDKSPHRCMNQGDPPKFDRKEFKDANAIGDYMKSSADMMKGCLADVSQIISEAFPDYEGLETYAKLKALHPYVNSLFIERNRRMR